MWGKFFMLEYLKWLESTNWTSLFFFWTQASILFLKNVFSQCTISFRNLSSICLWTPHLYLTHNAVCWVSDCSQHTPWTTLMLSLSLSVSPFLPLSLFLFLFLSLIRLLPLGLKLQFYFISLQPSQASHLYYMSTFPCLFRGVGWVYEVSFPLGPCFLKVPPFLNVLWEDGLKTKPGDLITHFSFCTSFTISLNLPGKSVFITSFSIHRHIKLFQSIDYYMLSHIIHVFQNKYWMIQW